jgi:hypothetical protein
VQPHRNQPEMQRILPACANRPGNTGHVSG